MVVVVKNRRWRRDNITAVISSPWNPATRSVDTSAKRPRSVNNNGIAIPADVEIDIKEYDSVDCDYWLDCQPSRPHSAGRLNPR